MPDASALRALLVEPLDPHIVVALVTRRFFQSFCDVPALLGEPCARGRARAGRRWGMATTTGLEIRNAND